MIVWLTIFSTESDVTADDERRCANGWITRKTHFDIGVCGNAALYYGRKFKFRCDHSLPGLCSPYISDAQISGLQTAVITAIVSHLKDGNEVLCFKIYDADKHRNPPSDSSKEWQYVPCDLVMHEDNNTLIDLVPIHSTYPEGVTQHNLKKRRVNKHFLNKFFRGVVTDYNAKADTYQVVYVDGDREDLSLAELVPILRC